MGIHILGICGTFMAGIAVLAKQLGHDVTGSDENVYPPMSAQLTAAGIPLVTGYLPENLKPEPDLVIVGNVIKRGNPAIEYVLNNRINYTSGPQWLCDTILHQKIVLAVAGTHGKTTTTSMLAWILEAANLNPSFLIGGVPQNFGISTRLTDSPYFVIEADEYDCAFFDKRSKFVHYRPTILVINNLEYDHADIFPDLAAIKQQFHHLVRTVPSEGYIFIPKNDKNITDVLDKGCWTRIKTLGIDEGDWQARAINHNGTRFQVYYQHELLGEVHWNLLGLHNVKNALSALSAAHAVGVSPLSAIAALSTFKNVKRRLEKRAEIKGVSIYDDFAHHPTAIAHTLAALRSHVNSDRIIAVAELASNTMRMGIHKDTLAAAFKSADAVHLLRHKNAAWDVAAIFKQFKSPYEIHDSVDNLIETLIPTLKPHDHVLIMSNGSFGGLHQKLIEQLEGLKR